MKTKKLRFQIFFLITDNQFDIPRKCLEVASVRCPDKFSRPVIRPMFEMQFNEFRKKLSRWNKFVDDTHNVMIFANNKYMLMSELLEILRINSCPTVIINQPKYESPWTRNLFNPDTVNPLRDYIFFNIHICGKTEGFLIIEVYTDINPKISKSFVEIFKQETINIGHYHVFKNGWLEFGIGPSTMPTRGHNHHPIMSHNARGILSYCEEFNIDCDPFFIHFVPCTFFDDLRTVLGRVVHGDTILTKIEKLETEFGKIEKPFKIHGCGIVPIGRNYPQEVDEEEWEKTVNDLFGTKYVPGITSSDKFSDIICPLFSMPIITDGEETEIVTSSSFSTAPTIKSEKDLDIEPLTFYYSDTTPDEYDQSSTAITTKEDEDQDSKHSLYSNELSLHGELNSQITSNEIICQDNEYTKLSEDYSTKSGSVPSLGVSIP